MPVEAQLHSQVECQNERGGFPFRFGRGSGYGSLLLSPLFLREPCHHLPRSLSIVMAKTRRGVKIS